MKRFPFRPILGGAILGALLFFAPFLLLRVLIFTLIISAIVRGIFRRRMRSWYFHQYGSPYQHFHNQQTLSLKPKATVRDISID